jgi:hypothetical protein
MGHHNIFESDHHDDHIDHRKEFHNSHERYYNGNIGYYPPSLGFYAGNVLRNLGNSRKLRFILLISLILVAGLIILALILIFPLLGGLFDIIRQEGLKGIIESITGFLNRLWNGG